MQMATIFRLEDFSWWGNNSFSHLGWFEGVLCRENNVYQESSLEVKNKPQFLSFSECGCDKFLDHDLVVWSRIGNQQALPHQQVGLVHLHKVRLEAKTNSKDYLDVSEGFASRLPQVSKLLLQSPGGRHSPLQQCPTLWKPKFERIDKLSTLKSNWGQHPKMLPE